ncbi:MAG TPA: diacylglycerol kinase family protein [Fibrobacteraceae bacterium]|nr:diacylglycerol kinase family protein [Fibrobacteraceae bacterium]
MGSRRKFHFLINPVSGGGEGKNVMGFLPEIMDSLGFSREDWLAEFTTPDGQGQAHAAMLAAEKLIAVGGDGTVSTVLHTLMLDKAYTDVQIGLIPLGTGNDLARVLNFYGAYANRGLLYLVRQLVQANSRPFDLWQVNGQYAMANYFSSGIDARIAHDFNRDRASGKVMGHSAWANKLHYVRRFWGDRAHRLHLVSLRFRDENDQWHSKNLSRFRTVIIGNIPSFASGANPFQDSNMADGLLEIVPVKHLFRFLGGVGMGQHFVRYLLPSDHAREIILELSESEYLQLDGEDLTGKLGNRIHITYAGQAQLLAL